MINLLLIIIIIILFLCYSLIMNNNKDNFIVEKQQPYKQIIQTPQTNYDQIQTNINKNLQWKKNLETSINPIPTINCPELKNKEDCNKFGCNWFSTFCSSTYPKDF
jgi:hypothetical protein